MPQSPNWTRDELILALDLHFRMAPTLASARLPEVIALSELLNALPIHKNRNTIENFRSPASVSMKLGNFYRLDPNYKGTGLDAGSKIDKEVWDDFANNPMLLRQTAESIIRNYQDPMASESALIEIQTDDEDGFAEGRILTRIHISRERNRKLVEKKKQQATTTIGVLFCEVCGFDFEKMYGELGKGFAECHHLVPLAELGPNQMTTLNDLAIMCANCHRMVHRSRPLKSIEDLREIVRSSRKNSYD